MRVGNTFLFGFYGDLQTFHLKEHFDIVLYFEDYMKTWDFFFFNDKVFISFECDIYQINDESSVYTRGPKDVNNDDLFVLLEYLNSFKRRYLKDTAILNKVWQLRLFNENSPKTYIANRAYSSSTPVISKSISNIKTKPFEFEKINDSNLSFPSMFQEKITGLELKIHYIRAQDDEYLLSIDTKNDLEDFLVDDIKLLTSDYAYYETILKLARLISSSSGMSYFDFDIIIKEDGNIKVLEWNNTICSSVLETFYYGYPLLSISSLKSEVSLVIAQSCDRVFQCLKNTKGSEYLKFLSLESYDTDNGWELFDANGKTYVSINGNISLVKNIYLRMAQVVGERKEVYDNLYQYLEWCNCKVLGKGASQYKNGSKPLQMSTTLNEASNDRIIIPKTIIRKSKSGVNDFIREGDWVVKSLSGERSIVVDEKIFSTWNHLSINNIPTMFQKKYIGPDIRLHSLDGETYNIIVKNKDNVDYRYSKRSKMEAYDSCQSLDDFCKQVNRCEDNPLMGIDVISYGDKFVCLEANPSPGWSWYYSEDSSFSKHLIRFMRYEQNY